MQALHFGTRWNILQLSPLRAAYFLGDLVGNGLGYLPAVFDRFPRLTILPFNSFADRCADPVGLGDNLADSVLDLVPFRGANFLRLFDTIALVLALVLPDRGANVRSRLPWLTLLPFDSFANGVADPISLGDVLANLVLNLAAVLLGWHWAVLGALDLHLLGDINAHLASRHALLPVHQAAAGLGHFVAGWLLLADLLQAVLGSPVALLDLGGPADLLVLLGLVPLQASLPLLGDGLALLAQLLLAHNLPAALAARHPDIVADFGGSFADSLGDIRAHLLRNGVALLWMAYALLLGLVNGLSDGFARFISALLIPNSVADFLGLVHVLALILALVLPDRVAHIGSRLPRLALLTLDGLADWLADGDAALVGATVEAADSIVGAVRTVVLSRTPADRLGVLGRAPVPG